jgi:Skp family chaperone for outer membrane proteins
MRRMLVICASIGAVLVPSALAADPTPADFKNAAKYCNAVRESKRVAAFQTQYGTNKNKRNAFGKCVSATNRAKAKAAKDDDEKADDGAEAKATAACKKEQSDNAAKFAQDYKNFGQCVKDKKHES